MSGPEHYQEAERLLARLEHIGIDPTNAEAVRNVQARAQTHATLALAAATARYVSADWNAVTNRTKDDDATR